MEQELFEKLYNANYRQAYNVAYLMTKDKGTAEDMTAEAFVSAYNNFEDLLNENKFGKWVNKIVANKCKDYFKKKKPMLFSELQNSDEDADADIPDFEDDKNDYSPESNIENKETLKIVENMLSNLPEDQRLCLLMFCEDEMKISDIAEALNISENTVKSKINYARKKMNAQKDEYQKDGNKLFGIAGIGFIPFLRSMLASNSSTPEISCEIRKKINSKCKSLRVNGEANMENDLDKLQKGKKANDIFNTVKKFVAARKLLSIIVAAVMLGAIATVVGVANSKPKYDLADYIKIDYNGYNHSVTYKYEKDYENLAEVISGIDEDKLDEDSGLAQALSSYGKVEKMLSEIDDGISVKTLVNGKEVENGYNDISNGDVLTLDVSWNKSLEKELKIKLKCSKISATVSGLEDATMVNPFDYSEFKTSGVSGKAVADFGIKELNGEKIDKYEIKRKEYYNASPSLAIGDVEIKFSLPEECKNLKNGDKVTVTATLSKQNSGIAIKENKKEYIVSGLPEPIKKKSDLSESQISELGEKAMSGEIDPSSDKGTNGFSDFKVLQTDCYVSTSADSKYANYIYVVYTYTSSFFGLKSTSYVCGAFYNVYQDSDGSVKYTGTEMFGRSEDIKNCESALNKHLSGYELKN